MRDCLTGRDTSRRALSYARRLCSVSRARVARCWTQVQSRQQFIRTLPHFNSDSRIVSTIPSPPYSRASVQCFCCFWTLFIKCFLCCTHITHADLVGTFTKRLGIRVQRILPALPCISFNVGIYNRFSTGFRGRAAHVGRNTT